MVKIAIWMEKEFLNNNLFNYKSHLNRDNCLSRFRKLKSYLESKNYEVNTYDIFKNQRVKPDVIIFLRIPRSFKFYSLPRSWKKVPRIALCLESKYIEPHFWSNDVTDKFDLIYTWNKKIISTNSKFHHINICDDLDQISDNVSFKDKKNLTLISSNKKSLGSGELYSKRLSVISWFEVNNENSFDFFGTNWDLAYFNFPYPLNYLNRILVLRKFFKPKFKNWKGKINSKEDILKKYKFAFAIENARENDYISEKIFDCFKAKCVPIYSGAPNINELIPSNCFINLDDFKTYEDLYIFLCSIDQKKYDDYTSNIKKYLNSRDAYLFSSEYFVNQIAKGVDLLL